MIQSFVDVLLDVEGLLEGQCLCRFLLVGGIDGVVPAIGVALRDLLAVKQEGQLLVGPR